MIQTEQLLRIEIRKDVYMKTISFKEFRNLPKHVLVLWIAALSLALIGGALLVMNMLDKGNIALSTALAFIVTGQVINVFGLMKYRDRLYK